MSLQGRLELLGWYWGGAALGWSAAACLLLYEIRVDPLPAVNSCYVSETGIGGRRFFIAIALWIAAAINGHLRCSSPPGALVGLAIGAILGFNVPADCSMSRGHYLELLIANPFFDFDRLNHTLVFGAAAASCAILLSRHETASETGTSGIVSSTVS